MKNKSTQNKAIKTKKAPKKTARRDPWSDEGMSLPRSATVFKLLQDGKQVNCTVVAKALEVSRKIAQATIDLMRDKMKLPIAYDRVKHSFYFYEPVDHFPGLPLTERELFVMFIINPAREMYKGTPFGQVVDSCFRKLLGRLDDEQKYILEDLDTEISFRPFGPEDVDIELIETLRKAIHNRCVVELEHMKPNDDEYVLRRVDPYHVMLCDGAWYLFTRDHGADDIRRFRISRMGKVTVLEEKFVFPKDFSVKKLLQKCFGIKSGQENHRVVVDLTRWLTRIIGKRRLNAVAQREMLADGGSRLTFELDSLDEIERWLMYWGEEVTVRENEELKKRLYHRAMKVAAKYVSAVYPDGLPAPETAPSATATAGVGA